MDGQPIDEDARAPLTGMPIIVPTCAPVEIEEPDVIIFKVGLTLSLKAVLYKDNYNRCFLRNLSSFSQ
jgi:hypothetical protein